MEPTPELEEADRTALTAHLREAVRAGGLLQPPEALWRSIEVAVDRRRQRRSRVRVALAAAVAAAAVVAWHGVDPRGDVDGPEGVAALIDESQRLERWRRAIVVDPRAWSPTERGLALRIADVDEELWRLGLEPDVAAEQQLATLWATRVELLETLIEEERASGVRPTLY
jgi:hypothetical protein